MPLANTARTLICEPVEYPRRLEACVDEKRQAELADAAWAAFQGAHPDAQYSCDYGQGFKDGFADYLFAGGTGNPPPLPPRWYWRAENKTPAGRLGEQDWFQGFRFGASAARHSGYREIETVGTWTALRRAPDADDAGPAAPANATLLPPLRAETAPSSPKPAVELGPPPRPAPPPPTIFQRLGLIDVELGPLPTGETNRPGP
jgi:hypothetical protein